MILMEIWEQIKGKNKKKKKTLQVMKIGGEGWRYIYIQLLVGKFSTRKLTTRYGTSYMKKF